MSWIDVAIVLVVVIAAFRGWGQGLFRQVGSLAGRVGGLVLGALYAPSVATRITHAVWRPVLVLALVWAASFVGALLGRFLGGQLSNLVPMEKFRTIDRSLGLVLSVTGTLVLCWLLAGVLSVVSWGTVSTAINRSVILRAMQHDLPAPPSVEGKLQSVLSAAHLPSLYASVTDPSFADSVRATLGATTVASGPDGVVKVIASSGCAFTVEGTGFVTGPDEVVTDAHLIAGQHDITVNGLGATVALFDPLQDLAVLRVAGLTDAPLLVASSQPTVSARVSVVGFQTASDVKTSAPGAYEGTVTAPSRSIYSGGLFLRRFALVAANVTVGNSGSPVLYRGTVVGVVIAKSSVTAHVAFAEPAVALARDLSKVSATSRASTQSCLN